MRNKDECEFWDSVNRALELATRLANGGDTDMAANAVFIARLKDDRLRRENQSI